MAEPEVKSNFEGELLHGSSKARSLLRMRGSVSFPRKCVQSHGTQKDLGRSGGGHGTGGARHAGSQEHLQEIPHRKSSKPGNDRTECVFFKVNFGSSTQRKDQKSDRAC